MVGHGAVDGVALFVGEVLGDGVGAVVVVQVTHHAGHTDGKQHHQQGNLLAPDFQALALVVNHAVAVQNRGQDGQEDGQQYRFDGEHKQVLGNLGNLEHHIGLAHDHLVVQIHKGSVQQDVHKQIDAEPAENHPGGGELYPVQKQGKNQAAADFRQNKGEEIGAAGNQDTA